MTNFAIKTITIFAACTGLAFRAESCPKRPMTDKRDAQAPRFAIVGLIDIDNDGNTDLELIRRLIKLNGGVIDAELRIDRKTIGELRPDTAYIILGQQPDKTTALPRVVKNYDAFMRRAAELNIRLLHVDKLLQSGTRRTTNERDIGSRFRRRRPPPKREAAY